VDDFRFDCGATWLNLLATSGRTFSPRPLERLATPERLARWFAGCELTPLSPPTAADVERARRLREILRVLAMSTVAGERPPERAARDLADFLAAHPDPVRLAVTERLLREPPPDAAAALARVARQAVDHLTGPERGNLAVCGEHDCRAVFADPGGRRRWCPSPACASRGRVRALRARRKAAEERA
jgi:predicted RNA-binding Zn ribbon-like protein